MANKAGLKKAASKEIRLKKFQEDLASLIPDIIDQCIDKETNFRDSQEAFFKFGDKIVNSMNLHFLFVEDVEAIYEWLNLPTVWMYKPPYHRLLFKEFIEIYSREDVGFTITDKLVEDLLTIRDESRNVV